MPYEWTQNDTCDICKLWPHNTLTMRGFATAVCVFFFFSTLPLITVLGTKAYWGLLPFSMGGVALFWVAVRRNGRDRQILEILEICPERTRLSRHQARKEDQLWEAPTYWTQLSLYKSEGPVPDYVTLKNQSREVEIGAFLSQEERIELHKDLRAALSRHRS